MHEDAVISAIMDELRRARILHLNWPHDIIHQAAIVAEEAGEVVKAVNDYHHHGKGSLDDIKKELVQTGAMVMRMLVNLPGGFIDDQNCNTWKTDSKKTTTIRTAWKVRDHILRSGNR